MSIKPDLIPKGNLARALFLVGVVALFFVIKYYEVLFGHQILGPFKDNTYLMGPLFGYLDKVFDSGQTPFWIDGMFYGMPVYDSPMFSLNYPFFFSFLEYDSTIQSIRRLDFIYITHFAFYCLSTYALLRYLGHSFWASLISSCLSINFLVFAKFMSWGLNIVSLSWLPLTIFAIVLIHESKHAKLGIALFALSSIGFTAKPSQPFIQVVIIATVIIASSVIAQRFKPRVLLNYGLAGLLALLVSGQGFLLAFKNIGDKLRWVAQGVTKVGAEKIEFKYFDPYFELNQLPEVIFKTSLGDGGPGANYIGPIALLLLLLGIFLFFYTKTKAYRWLILPLILLAIYFFLSTFNGPINLTKINAYIPLLNKIRQPVRHSFIFVLCIPFIAAVGFDAIHNSKHRRTIQLVLIAITLLVFASQYQLLNLDLFMVLGVSVLFAGASFYLIKTQKTFGFAVAVLGLMVFECVLTPPGPMAAEKHWTHNTSENLDAHKTLAALAPLINTDMDRVMFSDKSLSDAQWTMNGLFYGIRSFSGNFAPIPVRQFKEFQNKDNRPNYRLVTGAKYEIRTLNSAKLNVGEKIIYSNNKHEVVQREGANDWAYFVDQIVKSKSDKHILGHIKRNEAKGLLVVPEELAMTMEEIDLLKNSEKELMFTRINHNHFRITYQTPEEAILVINEYHSPDWNMLLNDEKHNFFTANLNQIGTVVPAGSGTIDLLYRPRGYDLLGYLKWLGFLAVAVFLYLELRSNGLIKRTISL